MEMQRCNATLNPLHSCLEDSSPSTSQITLPCEPQTFHIFEEYPKMERSNATSTFFHSNPSSPLISYTSILSDFDTRPVHALCTLASSSPGSEITMDGGRKPRRFWKVFKFWTHDGC
ncbi:uncharacterized protein SPPG_09037 [Spizellomyces punctatus DAOM BR117]|uniref:Uncharacterized protein n=1 Tax=Spizellomyces punctatus (strain DAOM BR117) TaxID=645134 RepID=A0A0L0HMR5_SPIPD|nr:uncharacterized protein SPPG_09037 [Spizellomyces punctatus DAOM BR117]KND02079.1 hypothetical protein SPPG_09037 [Spizellomyces punctatus DAOM BR117]|eukprot:XP_016610118.1 hypothetical protein SPPG_09037 [Spizellomyces punctatus DAOM BR117]